MGVAIGEVAVQVRIGDLRMDGTNGNIGRGADAQLHSRMYDANRGSGRERAAHSSSESHMHVLRSHADEDNIPVEEDNEIFNEFTNEDIYMASPEPEPEPEVSTPGSPLLGNHCFLQAKYIMTTKSHADEDNIPVEEDNEIFNEFTNEDIYMASPEPEPEPEVSTPGSPLTGVNGERLLLPIVVEHIDPADPYNVFHGQQLVNESSEPMELGSPVRDIFSYKSSEPMELGSPVCDIFSYKSSEPMELGSPVRDIFSYNGEDASIINFISYHAALLTQPMGVAIGEVAAQVRIGDLRLSPMEAEDGLVDREPGTRDNSEGDQRAEVSDPVPSTNDDTSAQSSTGTPRTTLSKRSSSSSAEDGPLSKKTRGTETRGTGSNNMLLTALENSIRDSSTTQVRIQQTETQNSHMGLQVQVVQQIPRDHADQDIPIQQDYTSQGGDVDNEIEPESVSISEDGDVDNEIEPEIVTISDNDDCDMATPDVTYYVLQLNNALAELAPIPPRSGSWQEGSLSHELDPLPPRVSNEQESSHSLECDPIPPSARNGQDSLALDTNAPRAGNEIEVSLSLDPIPSRANNELNHIPHPMAGNGQEGLLSPDPIPPRAANELDPNPPPRAGDGREGPLELDPIPPRAGNGQQFLNYPEYMEFDSPDPEFVNIFSYPDEEDINMDDYPSY